jgi:hypothetical protein
MATSRAANLAEKAMGHIGDAITEQNVSNPARDRERYADPSGEKMKALVWMGKNDVRVGKDLQLPPHPINADVVVVETPKPKIIEDKDVIVKVTGSTVCGSDLHLLHGTIQFPC